MLNEYIRARIIALRKQKGFTQQQLADKLVMDLRSYKRIESGEKKIIEPDLLERIAEALKESVASFLDNDEQLNNNAKN